MRPPALRILGLAVSLVAVVAMSSVGAADLFDDSDTSTWVTEPVPGTPFTVERPARWVVDASLAEAMEERPGDIRLVVTNPDNGDSVVVNRFAGDQGAWYHHFTDFEQQARLSAASSDGKLLATGRRTIAGAQAYWSLETYTDRAAGAPVFFVEFEIRTGRTRVLTFAINVDRAVPHARRLVMNLIENIGAE